MRYSTIKIEKFIHFLKIFHFFPIFFAVSYENFQFNNKILIIFFYNKNRRAELRGGYIFQHILHIKIIRFTALVKRYFFIIAKNGTKLASAATNNIASVIQHIALR